MLVKLFRTFLYRCWIWLNWFMKFFSECLSIMRCIPCITQIHISSLKCLQLLQISVWLREKPFPTKAFMQHKKVFSLYLVRTCSKLYSSYIFLLFSNYLQKYVRFKVIKLGKISGFVSTCWQSLIGFISFQIWATCLHDNYKYAHL